MAEAARDIFDDDGPAVGPARSTTGRRGAGLTVRWPRRDRSSIGGPASGEPPRRHPGGRCCTKDAPCLVHGLAMRA